VAYCRDWESREPSSSGFSLQHNRHMRPTRRLPLNANYFHFCANCCATFQLSSSRVPSSIFFVHFLFFAVFYRPFLFVRIIKSKSSAKIEMPFHVHTATSSQKKFLRSFIDFSCFTIGPNDVTVVGDYKRTYTIM